MLRKYWPELLVLVLFLLGDLLWNGYDSAVAGAAAGIAAFLVLLLSGRKKPGLIMEGLLFGGITALGELVAFPGGTVVLMELVFAAILLISVVFGKSIILTVVGEAGKGLFSREQSRVLSLTLGFVFLAHSLFCTVMDAFGFLNLWTGAALFAVTYLLALRLGKTSMRKATLSSLPVLAMENDGAFCLQLNGRITGRVLLTDETVTFVTVEIVSMESEPYEFLKQLEAALKARGVQSIVFDSWTGDELELEMQGFLRFQGKWRKMLR